jgi:NADH:ubiquinone oxidoreductase subunit E
MNKMNGQVEVSICYGTLCFVMGGSEFEIIQDQLPLNIRHLVHVKGMNCPGYCNKQENGKPPFVTINGKLMGEANLQKVISAITEELTNGTYK